MCKLLLMTGITEGKVAEEFMRRIAVPMSTYNRDGIGYTGVRSDGSLFSQRWHRNDMFLDKKNILTPEIAEEINRVLEPYASRLQHEPIEANYSESGDIDFDDVKTITMHTRFATCGKEFANTHPFIDQDVSLVHNGSIRNAESLKVNRISTCDSEAALQTYLNEGVARETENAKKWLDILSGSWAFGVLARNTEGNRILDVVRGSSTLYYMEIEGLGKVFATSDDDAKAIAKQMGLAFIQEPYLMKYDSMYRFDAITGENLGEIITKKTYSNPHYNQSGDYSRAKTGGNTTTSCSFVNRKASQQSSASAESKKDKQHNLAIMYAAMGQSAVDDLLPDIFLPNSNLDDPQYDYRKVKTYCHNINEPLTDRLDIFDMVFGSSYRDDYDSFPDALKEYVLDCDMMQGCKSARQLIKQLMEEKTK